jgi:hypothetical protein
VSAVVRSRNVTEIVGLRDMFREIRNAYKIELRNLGGKRPLGSRNWWEVGDSSTCLSHLMGSVHECVLGLWYVRYTQCIGKWIYSCRGVQRGRDCTKMNPTEGADPDRWITKEVHNLMKNNFFSEVGLSPLVLRPLLAYCTNPR